MKTLNKTWILILIAVVVLALVWVAWQYGFFNQLVTKEEALISDNDTTVEIDNDLNAVDIGSPDEDLKQLDSDLNQL
ncbi:MAG: hypothetical protein UU84_C0021G0007 [Candidatus Yanofskybacteria bacterium GW2011_GWC2_41_9]|uniref:Uncharacterized protein n=1 Tax=Candidatus Yanofskybacteria bacterium GW2011_GWC2_41_9 TaxID=1619029 RepID=A0A0G0ZXB9_9BACT|nr:MAG: hypothetical protein UU84_C0021G0007 [Candidatus Yanofskybacteria bacterium GW2011_GWC2_41_9]